MFCILFHFICSFQLDGVPYIGGVRWCTIYRGS